MALPRPSPAPASLGLPAEIFPSFRPRQYELAESLILSPAPHVHLNMPCGGGKSLVYYTSSLIFDLRLLILTPQIALQEQLMRDFGREAGGDLVSVMGQSRYNCPTFHNCEIGAANECPLRRAPIGDPGRCTNLIARDIARGSKRVVANNAYWMTEGKIKSTPSESGPLPGIGTFDLLVIDEGHKAPESLADFCTVTILEREIQSLLSTSTPSPSSSLSTWSEWARLLHPKAQDAYKKSDPGRQRMRLLSLMRDLQELSGIATDRGVQWIHQHDKYGEKDSFTPVWATPRADRLLFQGIPKVVLTSATLLPTIGTYLGIQPGQSEYIDVANTFNPADRPFIYAKSGVSLTYRSSPGDVRSLIHHYDRIMDLWKGYRGIYQTQSYDLQEKILEHSRHRDRYIVCEKGRDGLSAKDAVEMLKKSQEKHGMMVMGPALKEGVDLPGDMCRFGIVAKMPLVNRHDPVMDARCKSIPTYSNDQTSMQLMQSVGRNVRYMGDWAYNYTGDGSYEWVRKHLPQSFRVTERMEREIIPGPKERRG